jgi:hypothetical protein
MDRLPRLRPDGQALRGDGVKARLDAHHSAAVEEACRRDREFFEEHPDEPRYLRRPVDHEACLPGVRCWSLVGYLVETFQIAPGVRARSLVPAGARV